MKNILILIVILSFGLQSCNDDPIITTPESTDTVLIFGHFFGECWGEECIEIFRLDVNNLSEDTVDQYPRSDEFNELDFTIDLTDKIDLASNLLEEIPDELLSTEEKIIGMPDAGDWGGIYIEVEQQGTHDYWLMDHAVDNLPEELKDFRNKIVEAIERINK